MLISANRGERGGAELPNCSALFCPKPLLLLPLQHMGGLLQPSRSALGAAGCGFYRVGLGEEGCMVPGFVHLPHLFHILPDVTFSLLWLF